MQTEQSHIEMFDRRSLCEHTEKPENKSWERGVSGDKSPKHTWGSPSRIFKSRGT